MGKKIIIELNEIQAHSLYDLQYMLTPQVFDTIELNNIQEDVSEFFMQLEKVCVPEIYNAEFHKKIIDELNEKNTRLKNAKKNKMG